MIHSRTPRSRNAGVSLLEMLIALAVMAMLALLASSSLGTFTNFVARSRGIDESVEIALARNELRNWIERAIEEDALGERRAALRGDRSKVGVSSILDDGFFWPGELTEIEVALHNRDATARVSAMAHGLSDLEQQNVTRELVLSSAGGRLNVRYFGRLAEESSPIWHDSWENKNGLPVLIALEITDANQTYPPLYISPGRTFYLREMSLSSLLPPTLPSRP